MKAAPKQAENVACGSFTPSSVPATCTPVMAHEYRNHYDFIVISGSRMKNMVPEQCSHL